jgi:hypothetical protein
LYRLKSFCVLHTSQYVYLWTHPVVVLLLCLVRVSMSWVMVWFMSVGLLYVSSSVYQSVFCVSAYNGLKSKVCCSWTNNPFCWNVCIYRASQQFIVCLFMHVCRISLCFICFLIHVYYLRCSLHMWSLDCYFWCIFGVWNKKGTYIAETPYNKSAVAVLYQHYQHILDKGF